MTTSYLAGDRMDYMRFCLIADVVDNEPARLQVALDNIDRWLGNGHWAKKRLGQWREVIAAAMLTRGGMEHLQRLLRDDGEDARFLKGFAPFPGLLTKEERATIPWTPRH